MDRLNQLRGEAGNSRDSTLDTSSPPSEAYMTANESTSKYFSLSEVDSTFDISPIKDASSTIETERTITESDRLITNLSPIGKKNDFLGSYKIGKQIEAANILSGGVDIFDDNDNSYDGDELVIDDNVEGEEKCNPEVKLTDSQSKEENSNETTLIDTESEPRKDSTEVILQIDGKNVDAIDIGNGLYLYRKEGEEELAAVQIDEDQQQPNFKFLKVRENDEGNLEVYEEIQIEVPKEVPAQEGSSSEANISHVPIRDINKVISDITGSKATDKKIKTQSETLSTVANNADKDSSKDNCESKSETNGKLMKFHESRKSPVVGSFTPMTYHSTPNKEGIPLTKTMVDLHLHPKRQSDNVKKTIEVHTDIVKPKVDKNMKDKDDKIKIDDTDQKIETKDNCTILDPSNKGVKHNTDETINTHETSKVIYKDKQKENNRDVNKTECLSNHDVSVNKEDQPKPIDKHLEPILGISNQDEKVVEVVVADELHLATKNIDSEIILNDTKNNSVIDKSKNESANKEKVTTNATENLETCAKLKIGKIENLDKNSPSSDVKDDNSKENKIKDVNVSSQEIKKYEGSQIFKQICADNIKDKSTEDNVIDSVIDTTNVESMSNNDASATEKVLINLKETVNVASVSSNDESKSNISDDICKVPPSTGMQTEVNISNEKLLKPSDNKKIKLEDNLQPDSVNTDKTLHIIESNKVKSTSIKIIEQKILVPKEIIPQQQSSISDQNNIKEICNTECKPVFPQFAAKNKDIPTSKNTSSVVRTEADNQKSSTNNHVAVPFGKWTEANRQAFLNRIKETKVPSNSSNGKQIKNSNDLNRRDVLKKIDSHRQTYTSIPSTKVQDFGCSNRLPIKKEASVFSTKAVIQDNKIPVKTETSLSKMNSITAKKIVKPESLPKSQIDSTKITNECTDTLKKEPTQRKEINNQDLIDKTIEDIINRVVPVKSQPENVHDLMNETLHALQDKEKFDEIEKRMNELHGISSVTKASDYDIHHADHKTFVKSDTQKVLANKPSQIPNLLPFANKNQRKGVKENILDIDSEEEIIEHEPITGDLDLNKKHIAKLSISDKLEKTALINSDNPKKAAIITENDFDKFARRNSISYENCITVNFDDKEHHNVYQTVVQKESVLKTYSKREFSQRGNKLMSSLKFDKEKHSINSNQNTSKATAIQNEENANKNYKSKVKMAYQNAMTVKRQSERPITIIEDKPVKVVFMESNAEFIPKQLNVHGKELSPKKKETSNIDLSTVTSSDSLDSDTLESIDDGKYQDEAKLKTKHQRKQVLTPVETPELELIEPGDLGLEVSPKKKRKVEEKVEKSLKTVPKKSYLLGRGAIMDNEVSKPYEVTNSFEKEPFNLEISHITHKNTASAIDNLVKAAELLETQSENLTKTSLQIPNSDSQQNTPVKRGRGRPRKYPLPEGATDKSKTLTPQKKARLSDSKTAINQDTDNESSDDEITRENWTMGKINENIVCPICNKLFRSENVVFKHVKHCTGPSPNRSESSNKSPRRHRISQDSESKSSDTKLDEMDVDDSERPIKEIKQRKSRDTNPKSMSDKEEVIVIEDTPLKSKPHKTENRKHATSNKLTLNKCKKSDKGNDLMCEFCGKTFRQLSYLVNHKLQHEKDTKKNESDMVRATKSVFSCEVCKKEFRKLHHLVQHRFIHNTSAASSTKLLRKASSDQNDDKASKDRNVVRQKDDASAGFRCEPCDKSFRKLHHLVEHRETHDGINRQKNTTISGTVEKTQPPPQCEICKKTFRKLHHLIEHKELHLDTVSEKSDDKSVKSSLSTKDIIHECPLCYMVFPNEHSLNKHSIICQRKKRQSASKQNKPAEELDNVDKNSEIDNPGIEFDDTNQAIIETPEITNENVHSEIREKDRENIIDKNDTIVGSDFEKPNDLPAEAEVPKANITNEKPKEVDICKDDVLNESEKQVINEILDLPNSSKKLEEKESTKNQEIPKKKAQIKEKIAQTITKRQKSNLPLPTVESKESSDDDDEVRYMLNPDFKTDDNIEGKLFMKVRANKRNSLQIERPNSKDLFKRRISLQHHHKIPRLKTKSIQNKTVLTNAAAVTKGIKSEPAHFTDSDDSDIKYSFPKTASEKALKSNSEESSSKETGKKVQRKSLAEKRKSLNGIAKKKSLGKPMGAKHKVAQPAPLKPVKKRIAEAGHRCDCGQLFSSAALLARHTSLAHTPPRIRRRRDPDPDPQPEPEPGPKPKPAAAKPGVGASRKSSVKSDPADANPRAPVLRKSGARKAENETPDSRKSPKTGESCKSGPTDSKVRRYTAHKGVPVPEKMKKLMEKFKK